MPFTALDIIYVFTQTFETKENNQNKQRVKVTGGAISATSRSNESRTLADVKSRDTDVK
jgi:hypothetical protein